MCNVCGLNNFVKQDDVIRWHKNMNNLVSIFMESKLKGKVRSWLANKFDGVWVFISGLDSGSISAEVLIVMNFSLARHVCKVFEVPGRLLSIKLLFKDKLSMSILEIYAGASSVINSLIAKAINESSFIILGGDFNEDGSHKCASFKKCFDLVVDCGVDDIEDYFNTDHKAVYVSVELGGLLNKYDIRNASKVKWSEFRNATAVNAFSDLDVMWDIVHKVMVLSAGVMFKKKWFKDFDCVFNKISSRFHKLKLLVSKLVKTSWLVSGRNFASLLNTWNRLDSVGTLPVKSLFLSGANFDAICSGLAKVRKFYHSSKLLESKHAEESSVRQAIKRRMKSFEVDKSHIIRSVLERLFHKVVLDHLVDGGELVLEPELVKSKVDEIIKSWTRKRVVASDISGNWAKQFWPLDHVFNDAFSDVMHSIGFDEMFSVVSNLPDEKAAGFFVLDMLLVLLNFCLDCELVPGPWREAWVLMIPKPYKWEGVFTNTYSIALIETARKVFSKILSDRIFLACSTFDVLCGDNFSVLKSMSTQSPIFAIGLVIKDKHLKKSLVRIKMCDKFIRFFGSIHNGCINRVMTDFGLTDGYHVHNRLDQREKSICDYRLISHFVSKNGRLESQAGLMSFLAAVGSSQAATQHILNVASDFFCLNDILINNDKTVAISINCQVTAPYLTISGLPIFIAKRGEPHHYLGIFLSSEDFSKPSLILNWCPHYPLLFPACVRVSPSDNFLADVVRIFSRFDLSLSGSLAGAFHLRSGTPMSLVLGKIIFFKCISFLRHYGVVFVEQLYDQNGRSPHKGVCSSSNIHQSLGFGVICNDMLNVGATRLFVYTDGSLSNLGTVDMLAGAAVFFENIDSGLGVEAIALALECVLFFWSVDLFLDSQAAIDACRSESLSIGPNFRNCCWIKHRHIANVIHCKNLDVNWIKVKDHLGVLGNKHADVLAKNAALSAWHLSYLVSKRFLKAGVDMVFGNSRHFVCNVFRSIHRAHWEVGSGFQFVPGCLRADVDWLRSFLVWHLDSHMTTSFTSSRTAGFHTYFMKALHYCFPVAVRKRLYDKGYPSVVCLFCGEVEVSDHVFSCFSDADNHTGLLDTYAAAWEMHSGLSCSFSCVLQLLSTCILDVTVSMALCKGFVFNDWYYESVSVYKDPKVAVVNIVNFVCKFCLAFCDNIWLVCAKHRAIIEKNKLIPRDGFIPVTVSGFSAWLSAGVIRLLRVADAFGISFGYRKHCLFYAGVDNMASVHISA
ncbi:hypothetical protein G9A89_004435 [Geosiphon pyriformis]|nr:hypothetical protein G9A89_004435 [Geosiphon pyriformis]